MWPMLSFDGMDPAAFFSCLGRYVMVLFEI